MSFYEIEKYKTLDFFAKQTVEGFITGLHKSPFHGFSVEFAEHRLYNTGESTRNIDWKLYSRTDKLFVKRFEEETNLRCQLLIDQSSSMLFPIDNQGNFLHPNKLTFSVYAAALIVELLVRQRDAFGLTLFDENIKLQTEVRSSTLHQRHIYSILDNLLAPLQTRQFDKRTTSIVDTIHLMAEKMHRRSLVVIFTDVFLQQNDYEPFFDSLRHLRHCKHEVILFNVWDFDKELNFNYNNRPIYFYDMEREKKIKLFPHEVAARYREQMEHIANEVKQRAIQYRIDYVSVDVNRGFEQVMLPYLLKRSKHF